MEPLGRDKGNFDRNDEARLRRVLEIATRLEADAVGDRQERKLILQKLSAIESAIDRLGERLEQKLDDLEKNMSATLEQVFAAIDATGTKIIETINTETAEIAAQLEEKLAEISGQLGAAKAAEFQSIIDRVNALGSTAGDAIAAMVPTRVTPVEPTPDPEPVPEPEPAPIEVPVVEVPVTIEETPAEVGVDGGMSIQPEAPAQ